MEVLQEFLLLFFWSIFGPTRVGLHHPGKGKRVKETFCFLVLLAGLLLETMLSSVCEVTSWLDWWLSTCGGFREHLPEEVRGNLERLMLSGSRALEFLGGQGITALGNLVLSRRDSLLLDVHSTIPAEGVAHLRYSALPSSFA